MYYVYPAVFTLQDDGGYLVKVPDLEGCVTGGKTLEEAMKMAKDAFAACLCSYEDHQISLNPPSLPQDIVIENRNVFVSLIDADTVRYRIETDNRIVRKNVSIPSWLNAQAERAGVNFSQILQDGIKSKLGI